MTATASEITAKADVVKQAPAEQPHVALRGITCVFHSQGRSLHALGPIDLSLTKGEFFSVVGPSGCGKSTLLDILAGLNPPQTGTAHFEGKPIPGSTFTTMSHSVCAAPASIPPRSSDGSTMPSDSWD
jgi:NitT/TauT family transport system ATP-binding protein